MLTKSCATCGKSFEAVISKRRYCSRFCSWEGNRHDPRIKGRPRTSRTVKGQCLGCGMILDLTENQVARGLGKYCGPACYHTSRAGKERGYYGPNKNPEKRVCPVCHESFLVGGRGRKDKRQRLCSMICQRKMRYRRSMALCKELTPVEMGYFAGIMDGEGSVMLASHKNGSIYMLLSVTNTNRLLLERLIEMSGVGAISSQYREGQGNRNRKPSWFWRCASDTADSVLKTVLPALVAKKHQAGLAIAFQERLRDPFLKANHEWQLEWLAKMKAMNARGIKVVS